MVEHYLIIDQVLILLLLQIVELKIKVKRTHQMVDWLILLAMQLSHVRMLECLGDGDSLLWIKHEQLLKQVYGIRVSSLEHYIEIFSFPSRK